MKTYVINLRRSRERRDYMERHLARTGLDYEFVEAVDGAELTPEDRAELVDEEAVARSPHWLRPGMIATSLSHLAVYRRIVDRGDPYALVLEDDVVLRPAAKAVIAALPPLLGGAEAALLYYRSTRPCSFSEQGAAAVGPGRRLMYPIDVSPLNCTGAYVITRDACVRMADFVLPIRLGPDSWGRFYDEGALARIRCVVPRPIGARTDFKSTIDYLGDSSPLLQRTMTSISQRRIFPFHQLAAVRRSWIERKMSRFDVVPEASPMMLAETGRWD